MSTATCPNCGHSLTVRLLELDGPAPRPSLRFEAGPGALTCPNCGHSLTVRLLELDGPAPRPSLRFDGRHSGDTPPDRPRPGTERAIRPAVRRCRRATAEASC